MVGIRLRKNWIARSARGDLKISNKNEKRVKQVRGAPIRKKKVEPTLTVWESLGRYRDALDIILKTVVVLLPLSAIQMYIYLKLIGHENLFGSAVLSVAGLYALLHSTFIVCLALFFCLAGPSVVIWTIDSAGKHDPPKSFVRFACANAVLCALAYGGVFGFFGSEPATTGLMRGIAACFVVLFFAILGMAWWGPQWLHIVRSDVRTDDIGTVEQAVVPHAATSQIRRFLLRHSTYGRSTAVAVGMFIAGAFSVLAISAIYNFGDAYGFPASGLGAAAIMAGIVMASFLPGLVFLTLRSRGMSRIKAVKTTAYVAVAFAVAGPIPLRFIGPTITIATMRAIGVVDATPRTYEILKPEEREVYKELGFAPAGLQSPEYRSVKAVIGFQVGDVKMVCPHPFVFPRGWALAGTKNPVRIDPTGCLIAGKDEIRLVDMPDDNLQTTGTPTVQHGSQPAGKSEDEKRPESTVQGPGMADLVRYAERFSVGLLIAGLGILVPVIGRSRTAIVAGVGVSTMGLILSLTAGNKLEFTAVHLDHLIGSLQASYTGISQTIVQPAQDSVLVHVATIGPFIGGQHELDATAVSDCVASAVKSLGFSVASGWEIVGGVDKRALLASRAAIYGTNQGLAMARAVWVRDSVLGKLYAGIGASDAMVTIAGASNVGQRVDDSSLAADRSVQLYVIVDKAQAARYSGAVNCH
ncbi:hypothetical protein [Paraburkholderia fungorum]